MPVDPAAALAAEPMTSTYAWTQDDVILYHLGLGAGIEHPLADGELAYIYENGLKVLPSFGVVPPFSSIFALNEFPGIDINMMLVLHGEHELEIHRPIPTDATVTNTARIAAVADKGKAALITLELVTSGADGEPLFTNRAMIFARGEGGFGGDPGTSVTVTVPDREPDATFSSPTLVQQAHIYRLSGDKNPLHADPQFAAFAGFDRPILHGLATYGIALKAVVDGMLEGDTTRVAGYRARFSGVVFPGETIRTQAWRDGDEIVVQAATAERGETVLSNARVTLA